MDFFCEEITKTRVQNGTTPSVTIIKPYFMHNPCVSWIFYISGYFRTFKWLYVNSRKWFKFELQVCDNTFIKLAKNIFMHIYSHYMGEPLSVLRDSSPCDKSPCRSFWPRFEKYETKWIQVQKMQWFRMVSFYVY